jgi:integrase
MARARGIVVTLYHDHTPGRKKPWALLWRAYKTGHVGPGKRLSMWFTTEAEATEAKIELEKGLAADAPPPDVPTVSLRRVDSLGALAGEHPDKTKLTGWLADCQRTLAGATVRGYRSALRNYLAPEPGHRRYPGLGDLVISDATCSPIVFHEYLLALHAAGVSLSMRRRLQRVLSAFCTWAKFAGKLTGHNPCFDLGRKIRQKGELVVEHPPNPFTAAEVGQLFDQIAAVEPDYVPYFQFLLDVGVRVGEAGALPWTAIDWTARTATIAASYSPTEGADKDTKTHRVRVVQLSGRVLEQLERWQAEQRKEAFRRGRPTPRHVFTTRRLARLTPNSSVRDVLARSMAACGIAGHTLHDFRDTFATSHLVKNWDSKLAWVSNQLGHADPQVTAKHYYRYRPTTAAASFADDIVTWTS